MAESCAEADKCAVDDVTDMECAVRPDGHCEVISVIEDDVTSGNRAVFVEYDLNVRRETRAVDGDQRLRTMRHLDGFDADALGPLGLQFSLICALAGPEPPTMTTNPNASATTTRTILHGCLAAQSPAR
jgi:hypothetical protein